LTTKHKLLIEQFKQIIVFCVVEDAL